MASRFRFGEIASGIGEIRRTVKVIDDGAVFVYPGDDTEGLYGGNYDESAYHNFISKDEIFTFGFDKWGSKNAKVG